MSLLDKIQNTRHLNRVTSPPQWRPNWTATSQPPHQPPPAEDDASAHFSLLKEAAAVVASRGGTTIVCQVTDIDGKPCGLAASVKLADAAGDSLWACLDHADEILVTVRGAFIASQAQEGLSGYLSRRRG